MKRLLYGPPPWLMPDSALKGIRWIDAERRACNWFAAMVGLERRVEWINPDVSVEESDESLMKRVKEAVTLQSILE
jgi:hypothetical protein